jgi:hypothetical protein
MLMTDVLASEWTFFLAKLMLILGVFGLLRHLVALRCHAMIEVWAGQGGWMVVSTRRRFLRTGPFGFNPGLPVYQLVLTNALGRQRQAYVRCGHELISVLSDEMTIAWIGEPSGLSGG